MPLVLLLSCVARSEGRRGSPAPAPRPIVTPNLACSRAHFELYMKAFSAAVDAGECSSRVDQLLRDANRCCWLTCEVPSVAPGGPARPGWPQHRPVPHATTLISPSNQSLLLYATLPLVLIRRRRLCHVLLQPHQQHVGVREQRHHQPGPEGGGLGVFASGQMWSRRSPRALQHRATLCFSGRRWGAI